MTKNVMKGFKISILKELRTSNFQLKIHDSYYAESGNYMKTFIRRKNLIKNDEIANMVLIWSHVILLHPALI